MDPTKDSSFVRLNLIAVHPASKHTVVENTPRFRDFSCVGNSTFQSQRISQNRKSQLLLLHLGKLYVCVCVSLCISHSGMVLFCLWRLPGHYRCHYLELNLEVLETAEVVLV